MDQNDYLGLLRDLLKIVGAVLVTHGIITAGDNELIAGIAMAAFPIVWSFIVRRQSKAAVVNAAATGVPTQPSVASPVTPKAAP